MYAPLRGIGGAIDGVLVIAFDVTDEVRARDELARTVEYSEKFTAILGHDLRNPLNAIATTAQLLLRRATTPEGARPAKRIVFATERMARMITQLLDLARLRIDGRLVLSPRTLDLGELAESVLADLREQRTGARLELATVGPLRGTWDGDRLAEVLANLAGNAVDHGEPDTPVAVSLDGVDAGRIRIRVTNRGTIDPEVLPRLFDPYRTIEHRREATRGLGLGLYISKEIIAAHRGTIAVKSSAEEGTCISIELPREGDRAS